MNGAGLTPGSVTRSGASGDGRIMGVEAGVHSKLAEVRGLQKVTERGGFDEEVLGEWIRGEDVEAFKDPFEVVEARIISGSLEKASTSSPRIHPPRTSSSNPPSVTFHRPLTSANLLWTRASAPIILPPPLAPDPATDPGVRPAPFTLLPAHSLAHALTSLTP